MGWIRKDCYQSFGSTGISILLHLEVWALVETVKLLTWWSTTTSYYWWHRPLDLSPLNLLNIFPCFLQFRAKQIFIINAWIHVDSRVILLSAQCWNPELELFWKLTHPFESSPSSLRSTCWQDFITEYKYIKGNNARNLRSGSANPDTCLALNANSSDPFCDMHFISFTILSCTRLILQSFNFSFWWHDHRQFDWPPLLKAVEQAWEANGLPFSAHQWH